MARLDIQPPPSNWVLDAGAVSKDEALARAGWVRLSYEDAKAQGLRVEKNRGENWCVSFSGAYAYVKEDSDGGEACELLAAKLAEKAGIPCPETTLVRYTPDDKTRYACISPVLGEHQETIEDFWGRKSDTAAQKQVYQSLSYSLAFAQFIQHDDLKINPGNIVVARWADKNGKEAHGAYLIDYSLIEFFSYLPIKNTFIQWNGKLVLDENMYARGAEAIIKNLTKTDIKCIVEDVFDCCHIDKAKGAENFMLPPSEVVINRLCENRERLFASQRPRVARWGSHGKNLLLKVGRVFGKSCDENTSNRPPTIPRCNRKECGLA